MITQSVIVKYVKQILWFFCYCTGLLKVALLLVSKKFNGHPLMILMYHRFVDNNEEFIYKGDSVHHHIKHLTRELNFLKKNFDILSMDEAVRRMRSGLNFDKPAIAVTIDDGYLDNFLLAYPLLKTLQIPATIYLTTDLIDTNRRTWTDQIELALLKSKKTHFRFPAVFADTLVPMKSKKDKEIVNVKIAEALKLQPDTVRKTLLTEFFLSIGLEPSLLKDGPRTMLSWKEVLIMAKDGITFGAHSHTHPILSRMPLDKAKENILLSKQVIEWNLNKSVKHFAFPNGREEDFSEELRDYCEQLGFESVASAIYGPNDPASDSPMSLKRIGATSPVWMMAGGLFKEIVFWHLKHSRRAVQKAC